MNSLEYQFLKDLENLPFVDAIWLYGSRARHDENPRSDIDLAIVCPKATPAQWQEVLALIDQADTLLKIDCVRFDELTQAHPLRARIMQEKKVLFERNGE